MKTIRLLGQVLKAVAAELLYIPRPRRVRVRILEELPGAHHVPTYFRYAATLPDLADDSDVATRELTIDVDGARTAMTSDAATAEVTFEAREGSTVMLTLVDIDERDNRSAASAPLTFVAADTIAPAAPGALSVRAVEEFTRDDAPAPDDGGDVITPEVPA